MSRSKDDPPEPIEFAPPAWWGQLQREMGELLRSPLDASAGRFRAPTELYPPTLVAIVRDDAPGVHARLALYHEQYWKRLFTALQGSFPRAALAMGYYGFNGVASSFLQANPPRSFDLADASERFFATVMAALYALAAGATTEAGGSEYRVIEASLRALRRAV